MGGSSSTTRIFTAAVMRQLLPFGCPHYGTLSMEANGRTFAPRTSCMSHRAAARSNARFTSVPLPARSGGRRLRGIAFGKGCRKRAMHALDIGVHAREQAECLGRLVHAHSPTRQYTSAGRARSLDQLRLDRRIIDIG